MATTPIIVDCEGVAPGGTAVREWGAVPLLLLGPGAPRVSPGYFHGWADPTGALRYEYSYGGEPAVHVTVEKPTTLWTAFDEWLRTVAPGGVKFVSDNPAYDWQPINYGFHRALGHNPFGHSARRIGDYYAGLVRNWAETQAWKKLRITKHTHDPVDDARGNAEALVRLMRGER
jgi:hypothetical protein